MFQRLAPSPEHRCLSRLSFAATTASSLASRASRSNSSALRLAAVSTWRLLRSVSGSHDLSASLASFRTPWLAAYTTCTSSRPRLTLRPCYACRIEAALDTNVPNFRWRSEFRTLFMRCDAQTPKAAYGLTCAS